MHRDIGHNFLGKFIEFLYFKIWRLREIFCLFNLKSLLELVIYWFWREWMWGKIKWLITLSGPSHRLPYFRRIFFSSIIDASVNLVRDFPLRLKNKTKQNKTKNQTLNLWIDLGNFKVLFLRNSKELGFLCDGII